jgi:hypothetical protein
MMYKNSREYRDLITFIEQQHTARDNEIRILQRDNENIREILRTVKPKVLAAGAG